MCISGGAHGLRDIRLTRIIHYSVANLLSLSQTKRGGVLALTMEHRKHQRYPVRFKSIFSIDGMHIEDGVVTDLSLEGCRLTSAIHIPSNISIEMHIRPDQHAPVNVSGAVVCWESESVFGLAFKELPELESATLTRLLCLLPSWTEE